MAAGSVNGTPATPGPGTRNATATGVSVASDLIKMTGDGVWGDTRIESESERSRRINADMVQWTVNVPANGSADVTVTFDSQY